MPSKIKGVTLTEAQESSVSTPVPKSDDTSGVPTSTVAADSVVTSATTTITTVTARKEPLVQKVNNVSEAYLN